MAFTRATGKHRRPSRAALAPRAQSASRRSPPPVSIGHRSPRPGARRRTAHPRADRPDPGRHRRRVTSPSQVAAQADAQQRRRAEGQARRGEEADAQGGAAKKAEGGARGHSERAAREAERKRLNAFVAADHRLLRLHRLPGQRPLWSSGSHTGIDFHAASGTTVHAVGAGTVVEAGWGGAYGNNVVIKMHDGTYTQYGHLSSIGVSVGQRSPRASRSASPAPPATSPARTCTSRPAPTPGLRLGHRPGRVPAHARRQRLTTDGTRSSEAPAPSSRGLRVVSRRPCRSKKYPRIPARRRKFPFLQ